MKDLAFVLVASLIGSTHAFGLDATPFATRMPTSQRPSLLLQMSSPSESTTTTRPSGTGGYDGEFVDEAQAVANWDFPYTPDQLVQMAKALYDPDVRYGTKDGVACLADDFEFVGAVVGPLDKTSYLNALQNFDLEESFDIQGDR